MTKSFNEFQIHDNRSRYVLDYNGELTKKVFEIIAALSLITLGF